MKWLYIIPLLTACSLLPSTFDYNESKIITDIQQNIQHLTCTENEIENLTNNIEWMNLYITSKNDIDISNMVEILDKEIYELSKHSYPISKSYCTIKKKILIEHARILATTIQGRF